jgi:hypothetical protein
MLNRTAGRTVLQALADGESSVELPGICGRGEAYFHVSRIVELHRDRRRCSGYERGHTWDGDVRVAQVRPGSIG